MSCPQSANPMDTNGAIVVLNRLISHSAVLLDSFRKHIFQKACTSRTMKERCDCIVELCDCFFDMKAIKVQRQNAHFGLLTSHGTAAFIRSNISLDAFLCAKTSFADVSASLRALIPISSFLTNCSGGLACR